MEQNVRIELNINQLNVVLGALSKLTIEQGIDTFLVVRQQVEAQLQRQQAQQAPDFSVTE